MGDQLLREIARRVLSVAPEGSLVARLGGDEFAVLLDDVEDAAPAVDLARRIVSEVSRVRSIEERDVSVGASIGIALATATNNDVDELLRNADLAMYRAKAEGRGTWRIYNAEMDLIAQARRQLELDLRRAITVGDFRLYFQPIINVKEMRITSFEALMRWEHATRGLVSPADFIAIAEETGLIVPLGDWAIREACKHATHWPDEIRVAVNLSPVQLMRGNVVNSIISALATSQLPADRLEIEITESALLEKTEQTFSTLKQLREIGIRNSMDDFGTGYSSLNYLRSFQFDKIKIDKSFVMDVRPDSKSNSIVSAITELSNRFGLKTTAEGVETRQQLDYVSGQGCTEVQGRLFSMPVPPDDVVQLINKIKADWSK